MKKMTAFPLQYGLYIILTCSLCPSIIWAVDNSECFDCHSDESLTKESTDNILQVEITESLYVDEDTFEESIHNINGITCVDCHSDIEKLNWDEEVPHALYLETVHCASCHEDSGEEFKNSVHMKMRTKGITMTCYACHGYHYVQQMEGASVAERTNSICLKCHNPNQFHDWLPSGDAHFAHVECVVCHAPEVPRHIDLRFYDLLTKKFYEGDELLKIIGIDYDKIIQTIDKNKDEIIDMNEFDDLFFMLKQKNIRPILRAELVADINSIAHQINRESAQKTCEKCHASDSQYFKAVSIILTRDDGTVERYNIDRAILESYYVSHFYLLGGTRIKLLDKIGLLIIAGGACTILGHFIIRVLTVSLRRRKKENVN
jgi:nitrate/TMAO reductase-like tetraheme cytochrome c subunit